VRNRPLPAVLLWYGRVLFEPGEVLVTAWLNDVARMIMPVRGRRFRVIEQGVPPTMHFGVSVEERQRGYLPMVISGDVIKRQGVHVYTKHWPA